MLGYGSKVRFIAMLKKNLYEQLEQARAVRYVCGHFYVKDVNYWPVCVD